MTPLVLLILLLLIQIMNLEKMKENIDLYNESVLIISSIEQETINFAENHIFCKKEQIEKLNIIVWREWNIEKIKECYDNSTNINIFLVKHYQEEIYS